MAEPLFEGKDLASDLEAFFSTLDEIDHSFSEVLKDHLKIVSSTAEEKMSRSAFNAAVSSTILAPTDEAGPK